MNLATVGLIYVFYVQTMNQLWFKNNLIKLHPEILTPYHHRYNDETCPDQRSIDNEIQEVSQSTQRKSIIDVLIANANASK